MNTPHILTPEIINQIEDEEYIVMLAFGPAKVGYKRLYLVWRLAGEGFRVTHNHSTEVQDYGTFDEAVERYNDL